MIDIADFPDTDLSIEAARIAAGEPSETVPIAGLQFHDYGQPDGLGGTVSPRRGDRLQLVREPENPAHSAAIGVWWRNQHRLGHLPWQVAEDIAPRVDAGESVRAYLVREGDGRAWTASVLLIGEAVAAIHDADKAWLESQPPVIEDFEEEEWF